MAEPANMPNAARTAARQAHLAEIAAAERNALPGWTDGMISRARWAGLSSYSPRWVRDHNGGEPKPVWSTGEKIIVALILGNDRYLDDAGYTREEARSRLVGDLYGGDGDAWLADVRASF